MSRHTRWQAETKLPGSSEEEGGVYSEEEAAVRGGFVERHKPHMRTTRHRRQCSHQRVVLSGTVLVARRKCSAFYAMKALCVREQEMFSARACARKGVRRCACARHGSARQAARALVRRDACCCPAKRRRTEFQVVTAEVYHAKRPGFCSIRESSVAGMRTKNKRAVGETTTPLLNVVCPSSVYRRPEEGDGRG